MEMLILLGITAVVLNIAIYPLCKVVYRNEDAELIAEGRMKAKSEVMYFPKACWMISAVLLIFAIFAHNDKGAVTVLMGITCITVFFFCLVAIFQRNSYYTIDEERLTFVKHGKQEWSHSWDEIDHAKMRIVGTGKSYVVLYDIETKEGVKRRSLPSVLGRDLKEHVQMNNPFNYRLLFLLIFIIFLIVTLIALGIITR